MLAIAHEPLLVVDDEFRIVRVSDAFSRQFRIPLGVAIGTRLTDLSGGRWNIPELHQILKTGLHLEPEVRRSTIEADFGFGTRTLIINARRFTTEEGASLILLAIEDLTERAETEAKCAHLSSVVYSSADSIVSWGLDGNVTTWNEGATRLYGYLAAEMIGRPIGRLMPDDRPDEFDALLRRIRAGEQFDRFQTVRRRKDGTLVHISLSLSPMRDIGGNIVGATGVGRDVTARVAAEDALRRTVAQLKAVVSNVPMVLWALDRDGVITLSEGRLLKKLGSEPGQLVGQSSLEMYRDHKEIVASIIRALAGEQVHFNVQLSDVTLEAWYVPVKDAHGAMQGTIGIALDITERVRLEEQFRQAQKMEAVGRLAGGIAHDFNNLLTAILGYADLVADQLPAKSDLVSDIDQIRKAGLSASSLTRQLLAFSRRQMLKPEVICINDVVTRTETLLRRVIGEHIVFSTRLDPALGHANVDPGQIEQVILNLAVNAGDAMPEGGELTLETGNLMIDREFAAAHDGAKPGPHIMLKVTDTGAGMSADVRKQIFEPFFTTKEKTKGTGLGLATVYGIVQQSGGNIWVDSEPDRGTTFTICLPEVEAPYVDQWEAPHQSLATGTETILLVEDQEEVRRVASAILRRGGYKVVEAALPRTALSIVNDDQAHFDLLLTDVVMPEMSGRELANIVAGVRPDLKVLYTSGYAEDAIVQHGVLQPGLAFVAKPFTPKVLLEAVRATLDRDTGSM